MTDKELLEFSAKAAGYSIIHYAGARGLWLRGFDDEWNPLTDDGDALRLAVKLGFTVRVDNRAGFSWVKGFEGSTPHTDDPYAASRLAIVRAAAEIGKTK